MYSRAVSHIIEQEHVDEEADILLDVVGAMAVDEKSGRIPDLDRNQSTEHISQKELRADKPSFDILDKRIIPPDQINKYQIVDQLDIFDLFLILF